jgi:hypothetical protein
MKTYGAVLIGRDDDYGGRLAERAAYALNSCIESYDQVIYVDYNSHDNRTLIDSIGDNLIKKGKLRVIVVTPEQHLEFTKGFYRPQACCEVLARNIGLRRLVTDFMASTNIDEVNPPREQLYLMDDEFTMYTIARHGTPPDYIPSMGNPKDIVRIREQLQEKKFPQSWPYKTHDEDIYSVIAWPGDLQFAHANVWYGVYGFAEWQKGIGVHDSYIQRKVMEWGGKVESRFDINIYHIDHGKTGGYAEDRGGMETSECLTTNFIPPDGNLNPTWGFVGYKFKEFTI